MNNNTHYLQVHQYYHILFFIIHHSIIIYCLSLSAFRTYKQHISFCSCLFHTCKTTIAFCFQRSALADSIFSFALAYSASVNLSLYFVFSVPHLRIAYRILLLVFCTCRQLISFIFACSASVGNMLHFIFYGFIAAEWLL